MRVKLLPWEHSSRQEFKYGKVVASKNGVYSIRRDDGKIVDLDLCEIEVMYV